MCCQLHHPRKACPTVLERAHDPEAPLRHRARRRRGHPHAVRPGPSRSTCCAAGPWSSTSSTRSTSCEIDRAVVVVGHGAERVTKKLLDAAPRGPARVRRAAVQRGTGDAVGVALTAFGPDELDDADADVLVMPGDTPLLRAAHHRRPGRRPPGLRRRLHRPHRPHARPHRLRPDRPRSRRSGRCAIVEQADATDEEKEIDEVNTVDLLLPGAACSAPALRRISPENAQGEYYLTDVVEVLAGAGYRVVGRGGRRRRRHPGRERPPPAGRRRVRAAPPHERGLDAQGRHHGRPGAHLRRRHRRPRPRRHPLPRHDPPGSRASSAPAPSSAPTPAWSTASSAPGRWSRTPSAATPRSARAPTSARSPCWSPAAASLRGPGPGRSTLLVPPEPSRGHGAVVAPAEGPHGTHHQEAPAPRVGSSEPPARRGDRRAPRGDPGRRQPRSSSPTASCTPASASPCAAPTSSSSRPTPAPRAACRSTTRSWSS